MSVPVIVYGPAFPMNLSPLFVAYEHGFFAEEGVNVEFRMVLTGKDEEHPRKRWRRDGAIVFNSPAGSCPFRSVIERRDDSDFEVNVVSVARHTAHVLVGRAGMTTPSDLKGARLGADMKGGSGMDAKAVLRHFGVDPREVTWVDSRGKPPDTERYRVELFGKGELDAVCCDPPHWNHAVQLGGVRLTSARDLWEMPEAGLGTTPEAIARHPDVVQGMVRAALRGAEFARMNREETLDAVLRHNIHVDRALAGQLWDMLHNDWGPVTDLAAYQRKVDLYQAEWKLPKAPVGKYYDFRFLKRAMDDLRLLRTWDPKLDAA